MTTADAKARARKRLEGWLADTPRYLGDDPRAVHYRANVEALELAITALEASPNSRTEAMIECAIAWLLPHGADPEAAEIIDWLSAMQAARPIDRQEVRTATLCDGCGGSGISSYSHFSCSTCGGSGTAPTPIAPVQDDERR